MRYGAANSPNKEASVTLENTRVLLKSRPTGWVSEDNFEIVTRPACSPC